jgi:NADH-quinone oxidoreductase subunit N
VTTIASIKGPHVDWAGLSPLVALLGGVLVVLLVGLAHGRRARRVLVPVLTLIALGASLGLTIWQWGENKSIISEALRIDDLALMLNLLFIAAGIGATLMSLRSAAAEEAGEGEYHSLLLGAVAGMFVLSSAQNLVTIFIGLELLSIPLYILCATEMSRATSLESGLKYLIIGSVGSATLLYGMALMYGATGSTDFSGIAKALGADGGLATDPLALTGVGLIAVGLAFKASVAPFHQWTPDVYEGAPTPITAFMAVGTKAAAFGIILRFFDVALADTVLDWQPVLATLAAITIVVGNVGALGQSSLKRMMAWSSVAQAGYMLAGVVVASELGVRATVFYLAAYLVMNLAIFSVIAARERETPHGDDYAAISGLGRSNPLLAWPITIGVLGLAGFPATAGFIGKFFLVDATVDGDYTWLGVLIVVGSMISLGYYLRVAAAVWMQEAPAGDALPGALPAMAGGSPEADLADAPPARPAPSGRQRELELTALLFGAATVVLGVIPSPLFDLARDAGAALTGVL